MFSILAAVTSPATFLSLDWDQTQTETVQTVIAPGPFDSLVLSFSAYSGSGGALKFEAKVIYPGRETRWYQLPQWSVDSNLRRSFPYQKDADGAVDTDILNLVAPANKVAIRVTSIPGEDGFAPKLDHVYLSFANSAAKAGDDLPNKAAWGKQIEVPKKCQGDYANGGVLCSPTSVSMLISYWAEQEAKPFWAVDVSQVASAIYDPVWGGTGVWPYNTAFAAGLGLNAYVTRMNAISDLEHWIAEGIPVATSVSYDLLRGKGKRGENDGHLVVLIGFTKDGDPVFNDPGSRAELHHIYKRQDFERAWASSQRACYLVYPRERHAPRLKGGPWEQK
ncbi:MAG: peptidase C39 family protein [Armatimonadetes bacterium]|nr:peptidase C39 family protein [Armatimonadota bacterium]